MTKSPGALKGFLSTYGEKFPVGGKFAYKKAGIGVREKPQGYAAGCLELPPIGE